MPRLVGTGQQAMETKLWAGDYYLNFGSLPPASALIWDGQSTRRRLADYLAVAAGSIRSARNCVGTVKETCNAPTPNGAVNFSTVTEPHHYRRGFAGRETITLRPFSSPK